MSAASRARAAEKERQSVLSLLAANRVKLADWPAKNPERFPARPESAPMEPVPHWVLPVGEALVNPDYFSPPTAEMNGKPSPILTVRAFHHSLDPVLGVTFERTALGSPWVRTA